MDRTFSAWLANRWMRSRMSEAFEVNSCSWLPVLSAMCSVDDRGALTCDTSLNLSEPMKTTVNNSQQQSRDVAFTTLSSTKLMKHKSCTSGAWSGQVNYAPRPAYNELASSCLSLLIIRPL